MAALSADPATAVWVGNAARDGTGEPLEVLDPSSGRRLVEFPAAGPPDVDAAVEAAAAARMGEWAGWTPLDRGRLCSRVAAALLDDVESLADLVVRDAGLPVSMARRDVETAARYFEYYAGLADKLQGDTIPLGPGFIDYTVREPWGVCAAVLPFNVPMQMAARSLAPALIAGNVVVLKPAEQAPLAPLEMARRCALAGAPPGVVNAVTGTGAAGQRLVGHRLIDHITFTGSLGTGRRIMAAAAARVVPVILELGGKSPQLVFADADLDAAASTIVSSALRTAGQACSAGTLILVEEAVAAPLMERLATLVAALRVGPAAGDPDVGPVITAQQRDRILAAIEAAGEEGAEVLAGGTPTTEASGFFVTPTLLRAAGTAATAVREEIFGPVLTVLPFAGENGAVAIVNGSEYGLVAGIWTGDVSRAHRVAAAVSAGQVFVNNYGVGGGVELPFGGYRRSGFGRLKGVEGALQYTQVKNVCVALR
ncbi:MAG TPA: aldehyde dehydrogenase family protein [Candidatus Dormibacteraeota bacterium]|nr:aldehyde dehydrogenase family protein [Candidatus Dormibacteraeota bacterium]